MERGGIQYGLKHFRMCHQRRWWRQPGMRWTLPPSEGWKWFRDPSSCGVSAADCSCHGWIHTTNRKSCSSTVGGLAEKLHCTRVTRKWTASEKKQKKLALQFHPGWKMCGMGLVILNKAWWLHISVCTEKQHCIYQDTEEFCISGHFKQCRNKHLMLWFCKKCQSFMLRHHFGKQPPFIWRKNGLKPRRLIILTNHLHLG